MGHCGIQMGAWTLCVLLSWMSVGQAVAGPQYMVAIPAVLESAEMATVCVNLLQTNQSLSITVTLRSQEENTTIFSIADSDKFYSCTEFQVPSVKQEQIRNMEVVVEGDSFHSKEVRKVLIRAYKPQTFIQSDKPIYLPGQTVHFRVVSLDSKFRPASRRYDIIELKDANDNRIGQWLNETSNSKILQLSYSLNSECAEGTYKIKIETDGETISHWFKVEKYVLPKFEIKLTSASEINIHQEEFEAELCAKYTYGQPVPGKVTAEACRPLKRRFTAYTVVYPDSEDKASELIAPCHKETVQTDKKGCATFTFKLSLFTKVDKKVSHDTINLKVNMEEEGTGISFKQNKRLGISYVIGTLSFIDTPKVYVKGSNVEGKIKAVHYNNTPIANMMVYLFEGNRWSPRHLQNLTTDNDGIATFSLSTADLQGDINLLVSSKMTMEYDQYRTPYYNTEGHGINLAQDPSSLDTKHTSSLEVKTKEGELKCDTEEDIAIKYTIVGETQGSVEMVYLILSRGTIIKQGRQSIEVEDKKVTEGELSFKLAVSAKMAPEVQIVAYAVLPSENVIVHSADFSTEKCFSHKVSLEFAPSSAVPGEETTMKMTADPHALCGVSAIDQSVLIKEPEKTLNAEKIFDLLPVKKLNYIPYEAQDDYPCLNVRARRYIMPYPDDRDDPYTVFQNVGLKIATNLFIRVPRCLRFRGRLYHQGNDYGRPIAMGYIPQVSRVTQLSMAAPAGGEAFLDSPPLTPIETVRTFFPETWIWDLVEFGESGTKDVKYTVPDTITTWETEAFCLSSQGFGLAPRKEIKVFQPFFLELTLPYSIIRGENFELKATVFNYLPRCIMVFVAPTISSDYTLLPLSGDQYSSCVCANERKTLRWNMEPIALGTLDVTVTAEAVESQITCDNEIVEVPERGRIDKVTRSLIVKAEGTEMMKAYNWLLCPKENEDSTVETEIELPKDVIEGSARASVSVLGDIMGRALKNLDGLLKMPYGCGEQNIALLAPNIYILQYLKNTGQLTPVIKEKAIKFLTSGYQRQLNYKLHSGAYSTFGTGAGNTWLTAFVLRSFAKAQSFIYIEPALIIESKIWLESRQDSYGCFEQLGSLFNNRMKGGVSDEVTLSAYITAAFLEMNNSIHDPVVNRSLSCLRSSTRDLSNTYTTALMAYVFTLAGDLDTRDRLLNHLDKVSVSKGGFLHWDQTATETSDSLSVEISAYVLLAKLSHNPTAEDLGYTTRIVRWLSEQQNYYGGFSSTQDTVVALQALALYSTVAFSPDGSSTITVQSPSSQLAFDVNQHNKLLYQEKDLKDIEGKYSLQAKGTACASVQISLHYNIPTPTVVNTLSVDIKTEATCTSNPQRPKMTLTLKALYNGQENNTNMVILDIKMLSGFIPEPESLKKLRNPSLSSRVEQTKDHVLVYIPQLMKDKPHELNLEVLMDLTVKNLKPAVVKIYDYYQPSDQAETSYIYPCVTVQPVQNEE